MPRYNLRTLRGERVANKKEGARMTKWKSEYERFINDSRNVLSLEEVREEILVTLEDNAIEQINVSLICPLTKERICIPVRYRTCRHFQCFDLKGFLAMKAMRNFLECPICNAKISNELSGLCIDKYFQKILSEYNNATGAEILRDTYRVASTHSHSLRLITPKVIDDEEPYEPDHQTTYTDEVKTETGSNVEELDSDSSFDIDNGANESNAGTQALQVLDTLITGETTQSAHPITAEHSRPHTGEKPNKCSECSYVCVRAYHLREHMRTHAAKKPFKCSECSYASIRPDTLKRHMRTHTGVKPYKCTQCYYASARADHFETHMRIHTGEKPYKCDECIHTCASRNALAVHKRTHTSEKPYTCSLCTYASTRLDTLKAHMRTHSGMKPHKCWHCSFASAQLTNLKTHLRTHTGEKPYKCRQCSYACAVSSALKSHMRTHI